MLVYERLSREAGRLCEGKRNAAGIFNTGLASVPEPDFATNARLLASAGSWEGLKIGGVRCFHGERIATVHEW